MEFVPHNIFWVTARAKGLYGSGQALGAARVKEFSGYSETYYVGERVRDPSEHS